MNGSRQSIQALLDGVAAGHGGADGCQVAVCAPFPFLGLCESALAGTGVALGAQDISEHAGGAYTGDVSAAMLGEFGCRYALTGHSERRAHHHEDDQTVARKTRQAIRSGLIPIVCVGETSLERQRGQTESVLLRQVTAVAEALETDQLARLVIAYEPVWAIGTGVTATPDIAQQAHAIIRRCLTGYDAQAARRIPILYGGSMKPDNAAQLLAMPDINGGLIGGASLKADEFLAILRAGDVAHA